MKKLALFALVLTAAFSAPRAEAQFSLMPYLGYNLDSEGGLVGIGAEFAAPFSAGNLELAIRPSVEYVFVEDIELFGTEINTTLLQINADVVTRFSATPSFQPYAGAGLGILYASVESGGQSVSDTELGINVLGGLEFPGVLGFGDPFVQGRLTIADGSAIAILAGLSIPLGN